MTGWRRKYIGGVRWQLASLIGASIDAKPNRYGFEEEAMQRRLAIDFGLERGWRRTHADFAPGVLARGGTSNGRNDSPNLDNAYCELDHSDYYRHSDSNHAAAIVAHLYRRSKPFVEITKRGIKTSLPTDWPSWYYPGSTTLVLYEHAQIADDEIETDLPWELQLHRQRRGLAESRRSA